MRLSAFSIMAFFVCMNLSLYLLNQTSILGSGIGISPYSSPEDMNFISANLGTQGIVIAGSTITAALIIGYFAGNMIVGGTVGLILLALELIFPVVRWMLFGFPLFLADIGVPDMISSVIIVIMSFVWFWFFISLFAERTGVGEGY